MFHDLDSTLAELLRRELAPDLVEQVGVSFAAPDESFPPTSVPLPSINLFLYEIQENRELRSSEPSIERRADGSVLSVGPPVRVDCRYLVTAWAKAGVQQPEQDEHRILGEAMRVLLRHRELPSEVLRGSLRASSRPVRASALRSDPQRGRAELWQALGGRPKAAFEYVVTVEVVAQTPEEAGRAALVASF
jgi:uncharacterized protein DUF4255